MKATIERWLPFVVGLAGSVVVYLYLPATQTLNSPRWERLFSDAATLGGIIVGFVATAKAILFVLPDRPAIQFLRDSGHLRRLVRFLFADIRIWLFVCVTGVALSVAGVKLPPPWARVNLMIWAWALLSAVVCFIRSIRLVSQLLELQATGQRKRTLVHGRIGDRHTWSRSEVRRRTRRLTPE